MGLTKSVSGSTSFGSYVTETFGHLILAMWLLKAAPSIAKFFYPDPPPPTLRMWFAVGLRLLGFWEVLTAGNHFIYAMNVSMGFSKPMAGTYSFASDITHVFGHLILALCLINGAPNVARCVYPEPLPQKDESAANSSETWFAFGLRVLGFWEILTAGNHFIFGLNVSMGFTKPMAGTYSFASEMTHVFGHLILALWLIKWAPNIARFIYPEPPAQKDEPAATSSESATPSI